MKLYLVAVKLPVHAHDNPESAVVGALDGPLTPGRRKHIGANSAAADWVTAGCDISSIAAVSLPHNDAPDESALPLWPMRTLR
ncbi:hypothetical protein [Bradyrhizobium sp. CCGUVB23]|uniref:hypothetical protein n=1 Tax=Bradyrhizobium sp. CCGUVB23 TaxID=2949630 RepID=UPI0020B21264|nr:hypothetical protein [Bradyrhizobium sp. CCGUVB23]MCP3468144.1 hypothetical protein [Bradyrhizobium sp. CCGUVB23]